MNGQTKKVDFRLEKSVRIRVGLNRRIRGVTNACFDASTIINILPLKLWRPAFTWDDTLDLSVKFPCIHHACLESRQVVFVRRPLLVLFEPAIRGTITKKKGKARPEVLLIT